MSALPKLKKWRVAEGLSQEAAAKGISVNRITWWRWENGMVRVDTDRLPALCDLTGLSKADLRPDLFDDTTKAEQGAA